MKIIMSNILRLLLAVLVLVIFFAIMVLAHPTTRLLADGVIPGH